MSDQMRSNWKGQHHRTSLPVLEPERRRRHYDDEEEEEDEEDDRLSLPPALPNGGLSYRGRDSWRPSRHRKESLKSFEPLTVRFLKNGDRYFEGIKMNVSQRNVRSWDALLSELSRRIDLPAGVRHIYAPETGVRIRDLRQLEHNGVYVCGSTEPFRRIDYTQVRNPSWRGAKKSDNFIQLPPSVLSKNFPPRDLNASMSSSLTASMNSSQTLNASMHSTISDYNGLQDPQVIKRRRLVYKRKRPMQLASILEPEDARPSITLPTPMTSKPFMITVIRNGPTPRHSVSIYLNKEGIGSWEEARHLISENLHSTNGCLRLFTLSGDEVQSLSHLWKAGDVLIAAGAERFDISDFLKGTVAASETTLHSSTSERDSSHRHQDNTVKGKTELEPPPVVAQPGKTVSLDHMTPPPDSVEQEDDRHKMTSVPATVVTVADQNEDRKVVLQTESLEAPNTDKEVTARTEEVTVSPGSTHRDLQLEAPSPEMGQIPSEVLVSNASGNNNNGSAIQPQEEAEPNQTTQLPQPRIESPSVPSLLSQMRFPPTPSTGPHPSPARKAFANRRASRNFPLAFNVSQERSNSVASTDTDFELPAPGYTMRNLLMKKMYQTHNVRAFTPQSDFSLEPQQSLVDMTLPRDVMWGDTDASVVSSSSSEERRRQSRTIGIQTEFHSNEQLFTTIEADDEQSLCNSDHLKRRVKFRDSVASQTELIGGLEYKRRRELYHVGSITHEGNFAVVRQCREKATGKELALRVFSRAKMFAKDELILREIKIVRTLRNENVVQCFDHWETNDDIYLVMEHIVGSDLFDCILHCQHFSEADAAIAMRQLGIALVYLHAKRIVHRDIKPENIFLTLDPEGGWTLKVGGFSLATVITEPLSLVCGNRHYRSPEMITETGYGTKVDVWAAGVIGYILLSGTMPFGRSKTNLFANIVSGKFSFPHTFWKHVSEPAKEFVRHCLVVWPQQRFSSSEMLQHPWIKDGAPHVQAEQNEELSRSLTSMLSSKTAAKHLPAAPMLTITAVEHMKSLLKHHLRSGAAESEK